MLNDHTLGPEENLLYLLVICPGIAASGSGNSGDYQDEANTYSSFWDTAKGQVSVSVTWNKVADTVSVGKHQFKRETGSAFVVVQEPDGRLIATQLPSPGSSADPIAALVFIQKHMTNDALIASVRLAEQE